MRKIFELDKRLLSQDYSYTDKKGGWEYMLCSDGLKKYFALPDPLPEKIWLRLSTTKTRDSYRVTPINIRPSGYYHQTARIVVSTKEGPVGQAAFFALIEEIRKFGKAPCYLSIMYYGERL